MGRQPVGWVRPQATTHRIAVVALTRDDQDVDPSHCRTDRDATLLFREHARATRFPSDVPFSSPRLRPCWAQFSDVRFSLPYVHVPSRFPVANCSRDLGKLRRPRGWLWDKLPLPIMPILLAQITMSRSTSPKTERGPISPTTPDPAKPLDHAKPLVGPSDTVFFILSVCYRKAIHGD